MTTNHFNGLHYESERVFVILSLLICGSFGWFTPLNWRRLFQLSIPSELIESQIKKP